MRDSNVISITDVIVVVDLLLIHEKHNLPMPPTKARSYRRISIELLPSSIVAESKGHEDPPPLPDPYPRRYIIIRWSLKAKQEGDTRKVSKKNAIYGQT